MRSMPLPLLAKPRLLPVLALGLALLCVPAAWAGTWTIDPAHSSAQFVVRHMMVSNVRGEFAKLTGTVEFDPNDVTRSKVEATIDVATISTREPKRDEHLKSADFFDVSKYPTIVFRSKSVDKSGEGFKVTGDLTIRGVTREVVLEVDPLSQEIKGPGGIKRTGTSARTRINRKDFGLVWNRVLEAGGVAVGEEVAINIDVELISKATTEAGGNDNAR